jgi:hypothetical protein
MAGGKLCDIEDCNQGISEKTTDMSSTPSIGAIADITVAVTDGKPKLNHGHRRESLGLEKIGNKGNISNSLSVFSRDGAGIEMYEGYGNDR